MKFIDSGKEAVIEVYGVIGFEGFDKNDDENTARLMAEELDRVKNLKADSITVKINSLGGDVNHALAIHDMLADHPAAVTTQVNGLCASAATIIAMAGTVRKMSKNALFLIHKCSANPGRVNEDRLLAELESQRTVNGRLLAIYNSVCGDNKDVKSLLEANNGNGKWLTAAETLDFGFITEIYNESAKAACVSKAAFALSDLPELPEEYSGFLSEEQPAAPTFGEEAPQSFLNAIREFLFPAQKSTNTQNTQTMKNQFPLIASVAAIGDETAYAKESGHLFSDKQMQNLENQLKEFSELKNNHKKLADDKASLENCVSTITKERDDLKAIVDKLPGSTTNVDGKDNDGKPADTFADWQRNNGYYQSISKEL